MVPQPRSGSFTPNPFAHPIHTSFGHNSPRPSHPGALSAGASPSTSSPTASNDLTRFALAQVTLLLSTIKEDKDDPHKWDLRKESLKKLIDAHGMEAYARYLKALVVNNAAQIFSGPGQSVATSGNHHMLVGEMEKLSHEFEQARKIAESIESGTEDIFRDFNLSTFMEHFKLNALEKTALALAFKLGPRSDLKKQADAILSTNFPSFVNLLSKPPEYAVADPLDPDFLAELLDRFIQVHPPNFNAAAKKEFQHKVRVRYEESENFMPPSQVLAALDLIRLLGDRPPNALALYIHRTGPDFTSDEETCIRYLKTRPPNIQLNEEQVSAGLLYSTISQTPHHNPSVLVSALRSVLHDGFQWQDVVSYFDHSDVRITSAQFLRLYNALLPIALDHPDSFDIQRLWGGEWENPETQLSFVCAYSSLKPTQLDATTIPGLKPTFTLEEYALSPPTIRDYAAYAVTHPLVSEAALSAVFNVALHSTHASQSIEARRLFQDVVVPNLAIFVVSAFGVPKPWPSIPEETIRSLFPRFIEDSPDADFVNHSLWRKDKEWVKQRLWDLYEDDPYRISPIFALAVRHEWLAELVCILNNFGLELAAWAHAERRLDLQEWARGNANRATEMVRALLLFLRDRAEEETKRQAKQQPNEPEQVPSRFARPLQVRTVAALLQILEEFLPKAPVVELIDVQRKCIQAFPRLINYGEGVDDIIDANGRESNALPPAADTKMQEHYKKMYNDELQVRTIVDILERYKHSRDPLDQDTFACMIHGLFDEYPHYVDYPLEALATTAVLFGGIISHKLISDLPLQIGLGMILEAVRDHSPTQNMYKFGLQALIQLYGRLHEWPGFCKQLLQIPGLQGTEAWKNAEEVVRKHEEELARSRNGNSMSGHSSLMGNDALTNGNLEDGAGSEHHTPPFASVNVDPPPADIGFEEPSGDAQDKIQFFLNNLTDTTLQSMFNELREMLETKHQQWFASHLVEERAKMQPNYHHVYLELVKQFEDNSLWSEVLRETYVSVQRMLNSEMTVQNATERTHLKNLGGWLGLLTLARDQPIKQRNIAFKQLLMEAHDTKRLIIVIPFVCKVLLQGATSNVFKPPNPWLMDIIHLLIELYHNAELKLNLKFEIEVLCKGLSLDHKSIQPTGEILNRVVPVEEVVDLSGPDALEPFDNHSINGISNVGSVLSSTPAALPPIPDLGPNLSIPPTEVISSAKLHDIVRQALTQALREIIQPVVDRSVTIAAISTKEMIHKDFATEPDENRVRNAAINMVKSTAGSLALVTSKEPLRANFANYLRQFTSHSPDLPHGLPEGIIIACVNSNLDLASGVIEKSAEERAVPEIEDMIQPEIEARRLHRAQRPSEPYIDPSLSRWAMTIPHPFKMTPGPAGLNAEQMAIYDDFARQPRVIATTSTPSHVPSASDARSLANEVLGDQYSTVPGIPTPAETPAMPHIGVQLPHYAQGLNGIPNGRQVGLNQIAERVNNFLEKLVAAAAGAQEDDFRDLPRAHAVLDIIDALGGLIIKTQQTSDEFASYTASLISQMLFRQKDSKPLVLQSLVHVLDVLRRIAGPVSSQQIRNLFHQQPGDQFLHLNLIKALLPTDLLDWSSIDAALAKVLQEHKEGSIEFLDQLLDATLLNDSPLTLYADFVQSLEAAWTWITQEPNVPSGQHFKAKVLGSPPDLTNLSPEEAALRQQEQMDYVFEEWVHIDGNPLASDKAAKIFIQQMHSSGVISSEDDLFLFARRAIDKSVDAFDLSMHAGEGLTEAYKPIEALVRLMMIFATSHVEEGNANTGCIALLDSVLALGMMVLNNHHAKRQEGFNQRVFYRFFSMLLREIGLLEKEVDRTQLLLTFAARLHDLRPAIYPGFSFSWAALVSHRAFMPCMLDMPDKAGWAPFTNLLGLLLSYLGDLIKPFDISTAGKELYQAGLKLLIVLHHDYPEYLVANHVQLCERLPPHATQLINMILAATPVSLIEVPDPFQSGLKIDRVPDMKEAPPRTQDYVGDLRQVGLVEILEHILRDGPSEDAIAQISYAINRPDGDVTSFGYVPVSVNRKIIDAVVAFIGNFAINRPGSKNDSPGFIPGSSDTKTLHLLATELGPEARYHLLSSMINELRFANAHTLYFSQVIIDLFTHDLSDPEETEVRQQIVRILLERVVGFWPQPWGLVITVIELIKNDKCVFFELPFIKAAPEVAERFSTIVNSARVAA
ncbi:CCR4-Not complex component, Not1 domain containing protein [Rhypophila sp. PSN 637]